MLTREELLDIYRKFDNPKKDRDSVIEDMAAAVDAAMSKLADQEPVWWEVIDRATGNRETTDCNVDAEFYNEKGGYDVTPLYAHPMPCVSHASDKTACVSENGESDRQLARHQPCGCIICSCENEERCLGCGAKYCGTHDINETPNPVYVDHIPDAGKMIDGADEALRKELDLVGLDISAYNSPREALEALIDWHVSTTIDPRTNGGGQLVPIEPDQGLLISMACCLNHGFGLLDKEAQYSMLYDMEKLYDEVVGAGYYSQENRGRYLNMLADEHKYKGEGNDTTI